MTKLKLPINIAERYFGPLIDKKLRKKIIKNAYVIKPGDKVIYEEIYNDKTKKFRRIK